MSFLDNFPKTPSSEELKKEFMRFLGNQVPVGQATAGGPSSSSSSKGIKGKVKGQMQQQAVVQLSMTEMIHSGMWLIRHLPVSRDAVFDVISVTYDEFVKEYLSQTEVCMKGSRLGAKVLRR
jgi:hypothetical protein